MAFQEFSGELDVQFGGFAEFDGELDKPGRSAGDVVNDIGVTARKGVVGLNQSLIGLADILTSGRAGKIIEGAGYNAAERQQQLESQFSQETQEARRKTREAEGFIDTATAAIQNPSAIATTVGESIPQMLAGGAVGRGLVAGAKMAPVVAGAVGEGLTGAGSAAESIREQTADKLLTPEQSLSAIGSGVGTAAFAALGGKLAQKLNLADVDTMLAQGGANAVAAGAAKQGFIKQVVGSGISEGVFEELPQSIQEQMWQNFATDKPITEGVGNAAALGMLSGIAMGGVGGGFNSVAARQDRTPEQITAAVTSQPTLDDAINAADAIIGDELLNDAAGQYVAQSDQSAQQPVRDIGAVSNFNTGFSQVNELADLAFQERADVEARRNAIAAEQQAANALRLSSDLETTDARVAGATEEETRQSRLAALDSIYANPDERTPGMTFLAHLEANHPNNPIPTPEEKRIIAQREQAYQAFKAMPEEQPVDFGIPEPVTQQNVQRAPEAQIAKVDDFLARGFRPANGGRILQNDQGKKLILNTVQREYVKNLPKMEIPVSEIPATQAPSAQQPQEVGAPVKTAAQPIQSTEQSDGTVIPRTPANSQTDLRAARTGGDVVSVRSETGRVNTDTFERLSAMGDWLATSATPRDGGAADADARLPDGAGGAAVATPNKKPFAWKMPKAEFVAKKVSEGLSQDTAARGHENAVKLALKMKKDVPANVLSDYPDIAKGTENAQGPTESQPASPVRDVAASADAVVVGEDVPPTVKESLTVQQETSSAQDGNVKQTRTASFPLGAQVISDFKSDAEIKAHSSYKAAKAGDIQSAVDLVADLVSDGSIAAAKAEFGEDVAYLPVMALEASGKNQIPNALAAHYAEQTGGMLATGIFQTNKAFHTGADAMERMIARSEFEGKVIPRQKYVLVDDVSTMGGTLADMASYIQSQGGVVSGAVLLTNSSRSGSIEPDAKVIRSLGERHGQAIAELFGIEPSALTRDESQYLIGFRTTDELRNRAASASAERSRRILSKGQPESSGAGELAQPEKSTFSVAKQSAIAAVKSDTELSKSDKLNTIRALNSGDLAPEDVRDVVGKPETEIKTPMASRAESAKSGTAQAIFEAYGGEGDIDESLNIRAKSEAFSDIAEAEGFTVAGRGDKYLTLTKSFGITADGYDKQAVVKVRVSDHSNVNRGIHFNESDINIAPDDGYSRDTFEDALKKLRSVNVTDDLDTVFDPDIRASRSARTTGQTVASVKQATQALRNRWLGFRKIEIVQSDSDLPKSFTGPLLRSGVDPTGSEGWYDIKTKTVYLVADNIASPERAVWVAVHEVAGHGGVRMLGKTVADALDFAGKNGFVRKLSDAIANDRAGFKDADRVKQIFAGHDNLGYATVSSAWAAFKKSPNSHGLPASVVSELLNQRVMMDKVTATDEALAELAAATITDNVDAILNRYGVKVPAVMRQNLMGTIQRIIEAVRTFMAKVMGKSVDAVSDAEVYSMLTAMREAVEGKAQGYESSGDSQGAMASRAPTTGNRASWDAPEESKLDNVIYTLQDKHIDMKRVVEAIKEAGGNLVEKFNPYLAEELFHGRAAKRTQDFVNTELKPLLNDMRMRGLDIDALDQYLHARHAKEANALIAQRDPNMPDGGSGMTNQEADDYFASLPADKLARLESAAKRVDDIIAKTRDLYVSYGLVSKDQADSWAQMFQHYVPLMREDNDGGMGIGQGFSIKGKEVKHRTGSTAKVVDILANIALQREKAITRGEKNRVAVALAGLAKLNPNPEFWTFDKPPTERVLNEKTGMVEERIDPTFKSKPNVVVAKIKDSNGQVQERAVIFNERNERAMRMVEAFKNLDAVQLGGVMGVSAMITRYFASVNTQYNPIFGIVNIIRDVQGMALNLGSTPIAQHRADVIKLIPSAIKGIYQDSRAEREGKAAGSKWAQMWEELQDEGGMTGYRDLYRNSQDRAEAIEKELDPYRWQNNALGKVFTANGALKVPLKIAQNRAGWLFDLLSDYNQTLEGATRLAAYKVARDNGMSKQEAASLAKGITVNFNRRGHIGQQAGAMYAFFNAAMQGSARIAQTMLTLENGKIGLTKTGKAVVYGGITLGAMQSLMLAAAGFDDDEPPEFVRERAFILPIGNKKYLTLPMPLGFHVFPNIGRIPTEWALNGFKDTPERIIHLLGTAIEAFNPLGSAGMSLQTIMPTALDPLTALAENKDWTGKPIYKEDFSSMKPTPGFDRNKDTATAWSKGIAEALNYMSGGTDYVPGAISPTADQIDYLIAQVTGGVGREVSKAAQAVGTGFSGEELPPHKMPLVGRFYGDSGAQSSQGNAYYANLKRINEVEAEIKGRRENREPVDEYMQDNPEWRLIGRAKYVDKVIRRLRKQKSALIEQDAPRAKIKAIEDRITVEMQRLNEAARRLEEKEAA